MTTHVSRLHDATRAGEARRVAMLLNNVSLNIIHQRSDEGYTALHIAVLHGHRYIVQMLMEKGAARQDSAEDFSRLNALLCTAMDRILIPAYCFANS